MTLKHKIAASALCLLLFMPALGWAGASIADPDGTPSVGGNGEPTGPPAGGQPPTAQPLGLSSPTASDHPAQLDLAGWLQSVWNALRFALPGGV